MKVFAFWLYLLTSVHKIVSLHRLWWWLNKFAPLGLQAITLANDGIICWHRYMRQPVLICLILIRRDWRKQITPNWQRRSNQTVPIGVKNLLILYFITADDLTPFGRDSILQTGPCIPWGRLITANGYMFSKNFEIFTKLQRLNVCEIPHARHCHNPTEQLT